MTGPSSGGVGPGDDPDPSPPTGAVPAVQSRIARRRRAQRPVEGRTAAVVTAVVVLRSDVPRDDAAIETMTAEIQAAVKERKGSVQSPKRVVLTDSLPLTGLGKPDKKAVRARFWEGAGRAVG